MKPGGEDLTVQVESIYSPDRGEVMNAPHPKELIYVRFSETPEKGDIIRQEATPDK